MRVAVDRLYTNTASAVQRPSTATSSCKIDGVVPKKDVMVKGRGGVVVWVPVEELLGVGSGDPWVARMERQPGKMCYWWGN